MRFGKYPNASPNLFNPVPNSSKKSEYAAYVSVFILLLTSSTVLPLPSAYAGIPFTLGLTPLAALTASCSANNLL